MGVYHCFCNHGYHCAGKHNVIVDTINQSAKVHRLLGEKMLLPPTILIHDSSEAITDFNNNYNSEVLWCALKRVLVLPWIQVAGLAVDLPDNVHLLTVELLADKSVLIRVEQMFATKEDVNLSTPVTVNVKVGSYKSHMQSLWA